MVRHVLPHDGRPDGSGLKRCESLMHMRLNLGAPLMINPSGNLRPTDRMRTKSKADT